MTEQDIIAGCLKKDPACQRFLFERYAGRLMTVCLRYASCRPDAEDMLQDAFVRIFNYLHQYRHNGPFDGWLRTITVHACLRRLQQARLPFEKADDLEDHCEPVAPKAVSQLNEKELLRLISTLPDGYRVVFNLHVIEGYSHEEIAGLLHIEPATSRSQLLKARRQLQQKILSLQKITL